MKKYEVRDGERAFAFTGVLLGEASSAAPDRRRWFDLRLFRTEGGTYVIEGVGRSDITGEVDLPWVKLAGTPGDVVKALYRVDDSGVLRLTTVAQRALDQAAEKDKAFAITLVA